jgi:ABC-type bacteriocin/lantibiotic exporter with double-glycine peptidase domain
MTTSVRNLIVRQLAQLHGREVVTPSANDPADSHFVYQPGEHLRFIDDLIDYARGQNLTLLLQALDPAAFAEVLRASEHPIVFFEVLPAGDLQPIVAGRNPKTGRPYRYRIGSTVEDLPADSPLPPYLLTYGQTTHRPERQGQILFLTCFPTDSLVSDPERNPAQPLTPLQRLLRLLGNERKDITYLYVYAIIIGIISLSLPLGIQAIVGLIQGGVFFSSVYVLAGLVIAGTLVTGILQIVQVTLVEVLQRRVFAKAAFEFAYRIPRIRSEALLKYYPPELMNRFFDILTVQKALPKLLIDITAAVIQILFGTLLLAFYHPFFIAFGLFTFFLVFIVARVNAPKGLETSLNESKYKYKVAAWLEDLARTLYVFKVTGNTNLPTQRMDYLVNNYLSYREKHYKVLLTFFGNLVAFKTLVTGGLLILGTVLVVDRQITLGQFVASEIIIVLVVAAVEKLINSVDVVFDALTAVEKLGTVTDLPLERSKGLRVHFNRLTEAIAVRVRELSYRYDPESRPVLDRISFDLKPHESVCLTGSNGAGKDTLLKVLGGLLTTYEGAVQYNGISLRDINLNDLRDAVEKNISPDDIFDGTILENLTMNRSSVTFEDLQWTLRALNLNEPIAELPEGVHTPMVAGGRRFSDSFNAKITIGRCLIERPRLLMITDIYAYFERPERQTLVQFLCDKQNPWTFLTISSDPLILSACDRVIVLDEGRIVADGSFEAVKQHAYFQETTLTENG